MPASLAEYKRMMADRPPKFNEADCQFTPAARNKSGYYCDECMHWFDSPVGHRSVCEIYRPRDDGSVEPKAKCMFWTRTGERFPLLAKET